MAETEQPKKGSTSKFSDTLGKMDALIFNALGVNVETLLNALGIKKLDQLKTLDWSKVNLSQLFTLFYRLNPSQLKLLLGNFNLNSMNLTSLLSAVGIPANLIMLLETIRTQSSYGGGIFTGGTRVAGLTDFKANIGWLPGDSEEVLQQLLASGNYPTTGVVLNTPDDPNDPDYVPAGSENALNVLSGIESATDVITATTPPGGISSFYYEWVDTPVRFDVSKFVPFCEMSGFDFLRSYFCSQLGYVPSYSDFEITTEEGRVDLIANSIYEGTHNPSQYWWIILMYNGIYNIEDLKTGTKLKAPKLSDLEDIYFRVKSIGEG